MNVKLKGWRSFSSTKLFNIVVKTFFYMSTILLAYLIDQHIIEGSIFNVKNIISKTITFVWIYIEIKSIDETSMKLGNKSFWVILKELISKTKDLKKDINDLNE
jgi:phage-related holin